MNNDFISKELAQWLKERGCEIESGVCLLLDCNELCAQEDLGDYKIGVDAMLAYSWYSILVTHAKEFWGEKEVNNQNNTWRIPATKRRAQDLLDLLQEHNIEKAEAYVREHSLFASNPLSPL